VPLRKWYKKVQVTEKDPEEDASSPRLAYRTKPGSAAASNERFS
jgi:hypothetical protein